MNIRTFCTDLVGAFQQNVQASKKNHDCDEVIAVLEQGYKEAKTLFKQRKREQLLQLGVWYGLCSEEDMGRYLSSQS